MASRPALPVASLTLGSSRSSRSAERQHSSSGHGNLLGQQCSGGSDGDADQTHVLHSAGQALRDLLATAVPLHITVQL